MQITPCFLIDGYARGLLPPEFEAAAKMLMFDLTESWMAASISVSRMLDSKPKDIEIMFTFFLIAHRIA